MTLQKCQKKNIAKKLNSNLIFIWDFLENVFLTFEFCPWKNVQIVGNIPLIILIYICPI